MFPIKLPNPYVSKKMKVDFPIVIVGTGFAGLCMAIQLKRAGVETFTILEKQTDIGGTWRDNTYPGAACDIPSHMYSFSFELNPEWTRMYPRQKEIYDYMQACVEKYDLRNHIEFNRELIGADFEESSGFWTVHTKQDQDYSAKVLVNGLGPLNRENIPSFKNRDAYKGPAFHSSRWDHGVDLKDKRVAIVGTGASAIQIVPEVAKVAKQFHLFQRTAPWILPKPDREFSQEERNKFKKSTGAMRRLRNKIYWQNELFAVGFALNPKFMKYGEKFALSYLEKKVRDPELREKLTPKFTMGCKRVLLSKTYYPALQKDNAEVVTDVIEEFTETGIRTVDGQLREVDVVIFCTGFHASEFPAWLRVKGIGGKDLMDEWQNTGPEGYFGMSTPDFPNAYLLVGPNTGLGHNSIIFMIESQVKYILQCIHRIADKNLRYLDVKEDVTSKHNERLQERLSKKVWADCQSWYLTEEGKNTTLWPGFTFEYWLRTSRVKFAAFREVE